MTELQQKFVAAVQTAVLMEYTSALAVTLNVPYWHWLQCVIYAMETSDDKITDLINKHGNTAAAVAEFCRWKDSPAGFSSLKETPVKMTNYDEQRAELVAKSCADEKDSVIKRLKQTVTDRTTELNNWRTRAEQAEAQLRLVNDIFVQMKEVVSGK